MGLGSLALGLVGFNVCTVVPRCMYLDLGVKLLNGNNAQGLV